MSKSLICFAFPGKRKFSLILLFQRWRSFICWGEQHSCGGDIEGNEECWLETMLTLEVPADWICRGLAIWSRYCWRKKNIKSLWLDLSQGDSVEISSSVIFYLFSPYRSLANCEERRYIIIAWKTKICYCLKHAQIWEKKKEGKGRRSNTFGANTTLEVQKKTVIYEYLDLSNIALQVGYYL